ncbi:MAG: hypothetical protein Roseis3KO_45990 [Roseivirga sp.]
MLESIYTQTNKRVFEAGEDLWFSATILNSQSLNPSAKSKSLFVVLQDEKDDFKVLQEVYEVSQSFVQGHLYLPDTLSPGIYKLSVFTPYSITGQKEVKATKRIEVKDRVIPNLLVEHLFDQRQYTSKDRKLSGTIKVWQRNGDILSKASLTVGLYQGAKRIKRQKLKWRSDSLIGYEFPIDKNIEGYSVRVNVQDEEERSGYVSMAVPLNLSKKVQLNFMPEGGHLVKDLSTKVAFKAVDRNGDPFEIYKASILNSRGELVMEVATQHAGMGMFYFIPQLEDYTLKIESPGVDSIYRLPKVLRSGIQMNVHRHTKKELSLGLAKSSQVLNDSVQISVRQRGLLVWQAGVWLAGHGKVIKIPVEDMVPGIASIELVNNGGQVLSERLVFLNLHKKLNVEITASKNNYTTKEKVELVVKVTDENGRPMRTVFGMSVVEEAYRHTFSDGNILSYFMLNNDLRGRIVDPAYYFETDNTQAKAHLDLLMMTQGWSSYEWAVLPVQEASETSAISEDMYAEIELSFDRERRRFRPKRNQPIKVMTTGGMLVRKTDSLQRIKVEPVMLKMAEGGELAFKSGDEVFEVTNVKLLSLFDEIGETFHVRVQDRKNWVDPVKTRNWDKLPTFLWDATKLDDFEVTGVSDTYGKNSGAPVNSLKVSMDYVCEDGFLNCPHHPTGTSPVVGEKYFYFRKKPDGSRDIDVMVYATSAASGTLTVKGYYSQKVYYEPDYDKRPKKREVPDFRNTLVWKPNVVTDENGEAVVSFFTSDIRNIFNGRIEAYGGNGQFGFLKFNINVLR